MTRSRAMPFRVKCLETAAVTAPGKPEMRTAASRNFPPVRPCKLPLFFIASRMLVCKRANNVKMQIRTLKSTSLRALAWIWGHASATLRENVSLGEVHSYDSCRPQHGLHAYRRLTFHSLLLLLMYGCLVF